MGTTARPDTVCKLLKKHGFDNVKRIRKQAGSTSRSAHVQFQNIARLNKAAYMANGSLVVISIDIKKKELIGNFSLEGHTYTQAPVDALNDDFRSAGEGKLIPYGIYELA